MQFQVVQVHEVLMSDIIVSVHGKDLYKIPVPGQDDDLLAVVIAHLLTGKFLQFFVYIG